MGLLGANPQGPSQLHLLLSSAVTPGASGGPTGLVQGLGVPGAGLWVSMAVV